MTSQDFHFDQGFVSWGCRSGNNHPELFVYRHINENEVVRHLYQQERKFSFKIQMVIGPSFSDAIIDDFNYDMVEKACVESVGMKMVCVLYPNEILEMRSNPKDSENLNKYILCIMSRFYAHGWHVVNDNRRNQLEEVKQKAGNFDIDDFVVKKVASHLKIKKKPK